MALQTLSRIVQIVTMDVEPAFEDELNQWYDEEHIDALLGVPGYLSAERFVAVEGAPKYMAFYQLESAEAARSEAHRVAAETPWTHRMREHMRNARIEFYEQLTTSDGEIHGPEWGKGATPGALMVMRMSVSPEHDEEFNAWYECEHFPQICAVDGVHVGRRYRALEGSAPLYMARYDIDKVETHGSPAWDVAAETPWTFHVRTHHFDRWKVVYTPMGPAKFGTSGGAK
jgi:hypothetical protein